MTLDFYTLRIHFGKVSRAGGNIWIDVILLKAQAE